MSKNQPFKTFMAFEATWTPKKFDTEKVRNNISPPINVNYFYTINLLNVEP